MTVKYKYQLECVKTGKKLRAFPFFYSNNSKPSFASVSPLSWVSEKKAESKLLEYNISNAIHGGGLWPEVKLIKKKIETTTEKYEPSPNLSHGQLLNVLKHVFENNKGNVKRQEWSEPFIEWLSNLASMKKPINYVVIAKKGKIPENVKCSFSICKSFLFMVVETEEDVMHIKLSSIEIGLIAHYDRGIIYHKEGMLFA